MGNRNANLVKLLQIWNQPGREALKQQLLRKALEEEEHGAPVLFGDEVFWDVKGNVFPIGTDTSAEFAKVLFDDDAPFSPDGVNHYKYVAAYTGTGSPKVTFCFSDDGISWTGATKPTGIVATADHVEIVKAPEGLRIWYWTGATTGTPADVRTAVCRLNNIPRFTNDAPLENGAVPWCGAGAPAWAAQSYGPSSLFPRIRQITDPADLLTKAYFGGMVLYSGTQEAIELVTSDDGVVWDRYSGWPIMGYGSGGSWDDHDVSYLHAWLDDALRWRVMYSGGSVAGTSTPVEGIGLAIQDDNGVFVKHPSNPVFKYGTGDWTQGCYAPCFVKRHHSVATGAPGLQHHLVDFLYYTAVDGSGNKRVKRAELVSDWTTKATLNFDTDDQGKVLP